MAEGIIDNSPQGTGYGMKVVSGGAALVTSTAVNPTSITNPVGSLVYQGDLLGSIVKFIDDGEFVKVLTYSGTTNTLVGIGSWVTL